MAKQPPSALITDAGKRVHLRIHGRYYDLSQAELRLALGLPAGPVGLGITIERDRLHFEFPADNQHVVIKASQLHRLLARQATAS